jgi:hypothetical protein
MVRYEGIAPTDRNRGTGYAGIVRTGAKSDAAAYLKIKTATRRSPQYVLNGSPEAAIHWFLVLRLTERPYMDASPPFCQTLYLAPGPESRVAGRTGRLPHGRTSLLNGYGYEGLKQQF